jgi:hypothetical protein
MLGAVIKFINKDNADKEVAKHNEIIEEYKTISEQMRKTNDELGLMLSEDTSKMGEQQLAFIRALAETRGMFQSQMKEILSVVGGSPVIEYATPHNPQEYKQERKRAITHGKKSIEPKRPIRQIGFNVNSKDELIDTILESVKSAGDKIPSKSSLVDITNRRHKSIYETTMKDLRGMGIVEYKRGSGYYMAVDKDVAQREIFEAYN